MTAAVRDRPEFRKAAEGAEGPAGERAALFLTLTLTLTLNLTLTLTLTVTLTLGSKRSWLRNRDGGFDFEK